MISQVTFFVDHGESTDELQQWIADAESEAEYSGTVRVIAADFIVDVPDPGVEASLAPLSWEERGKVESGTPLTYAPTHESVFDGSDVMLVRDNGDDTITVMNEDGYTWADPSAHWRPIE